MKWKEQRDDDINWLKKMFKEFKYYPKTRRVQVDGKHYGIVKLRQQLHDEALIKEINSQIKEQVELEITVEDIKIPEPPEEPEELEEPKEAKKSRKKRKETDE